MIDLAMSFLADEINNYLELISEVDQPPLLVLTNIADEQGGWAIPDNRLGLSLINIEEEKVFKEQKSTFKNEAGNFENFNPEIKLNLYILVTANFTGNGSEGIPGTFYRDGLKHLSGVISFFQGKNVFSTANSPNLSPKIEKLTVELFSYSFEQLYNFWSVIGAKYLPSVLYKVRIITIQEKNIHLEGPPITTIRGELFNI